MDTPDSQTAFGNGSAFSCKMCGQCCHGSGGIVLAPKDIARLAAHLELEPAAFLQRHAENKAGKQRLKVREDGYCVFFHEGCAVHPAKPDICRAWPYFRGNLEDAYSLAMAKEYCPGIAPGVSFNAFSAEGRAFLKREGLLQDTDEGANALRLPQDRSETGS